MKLLKGNAAPSFESTDIYDDIISLNRFKNKHKFLVFFRNVACPFCNLKVLEFAAQKAEFESILVQPIFFFESTTEQIQSSLYSQKIFPIPIVANPDLNIYQKYGVEKSFVKKMSTFLNPKALSDIKTVVPKMRATYAPLDDTSLLIPASFLINQKNEILLAKYGKDMRDVLSLKDIQEVLKHN